MKSGKVKKQNRMERVLEIRKKDIIICHVIMFSGLAVAAFGGYLAFHRSGFAFPVIFLGFIIASFGLFSRDWFFRCPSCGQTLFKKAPYINRIKGKCPTNCKKCSWHVKIEIK